MPQGTLIERIRAGGFGLGGVLTPTCVGTVVEKGKQRIEVAGKPYLLETALRADFSRSCATALPNAEQNDGVQLLDASLSQGLGVNPGLG